MKQADEHTYTVTWSEEDQEFVGLCAEFPSLSWLARSQEEAWLGIVSVVTQAMQDMQKSDE